MADSKKVAEYYPAVRDFRAKEMILFRGDVLSYRANIDNPSYSTDAQGFRHSTLGGKLYSVADCTRAPRYGLVLGASNVFAAGLGGNENTMASRLSERFGFPFANAAMPGANSRTLNSLLVGLMAGASQPPEVVVLSNGGDLANFCDAGFVDPIFGSPNYVQSKLIRKLGLAAEVDDQLGALLVFTSLWVSAMATLCRVRNVPLVLLHQSTIFEKLKPSRQEQDCRLGEARSRGQERLFANFRKFNAPFFDKRQELARRFNLPIAGVGLTERLSFIDEFHLDADGMKVLSEAVADTVAPLLEKSGSKAKVEA